MHTTNPYFILGLMSGTSADGIDAVAARFASSAGRLQWRLVAHMHQPFTARLRRRIIEASLEGKVAEICELNFVLGELFAHAALAVIRKAGLKPKQIAAIGSHGQTLHHLPNSRPPSTLQIGEAAVIAERTGITTIADFRVREMAAGGQGAPLVAFADWVLFTDRSKPRIIQNIGGIANLTYLPPGGNLSAVRAFDTGPGNMVLDAVVLELTRGRQGFDRNGQWARRGRISEQLLERMNAHPFLRRLPPKTTGREEFGGPFVSKVLAEAKRLRLPAEDIMATVTAFTAATIVQAYQRFVLPRIKPEQRAKLEIILGGGGAKNRALQQMLRERLGGWTLLTHENMGLPGAAKEALAFAILAYHTLLGRPSNVPSATGARRAVVLGKIVPG